VLKQGMPVDAELVPAAPKPQSGGGGR